MSRLYRRQPVPMTENIAAGETSRLGSLDATHERKLMGVGSSVRLGAARTETPIFPGFRRSFNETVG